MDNKISTNKIIADIKATKGNRSGCQGLHSSLESDGYLTSICKWARATSPKRIDALVELIEKQETALISWEKTMMEVCGEDGPASVANEIRALRGLRDTAMQALRAQVEQLAAENVGLRETIDAVRGVADNSSGIAGYHLNGDIAKWSDILPEIDDLETPATNAAIAGIKADGVDSGIKTIITMLNHRAPGVIDAINVLGVHSFELREGAK